MSFPASSEPVYIGGGLWLLAKVLDVSDALKGTDAIRVAVNLALSTMTPEEREQAVQDGPFQGRSVAMVTKQTKAVAGIARTAVMGHHWSDVAKAAEDALAAKYKALDHEAAERYRVVEQEAEAAAERGEEFDRAASVASVDAWLGAQMEAADAAFDPGPAPESWQPITIVGNPEDEDRVRHKISVAALDQVSMTWSYLVSDVALRASMRARREVRPLSRPAR